ncbi:hypothetical protein [Bradyrhizobium sp. USDA 4353]
MDKLICQAIAARKVISFTYEGRLRTVEPHTLGYSLKGIMTLSAWQLSGGSAIDWRDYHCSKMANLSVTDQQFSGPRPGYNPHPATFSSVLCRI